MRGFHQVKEFLLRYCQLARDVFPFDESLSQGQTSMQIFQGFPAFSR